MFKILLIYLIKYSKLSISFPWLFIWSFFYLIIRFFSSFLSNKSDNYKDWDLIFYNN